MLPRRAMAAGYTKQLANLHGSSCNMIKLASFAVGSTECPLPSGFDVSLIDGRWLILVGAAARHVLVGRGPLPVSSASTR